MFPAIRKRAVTFEVRGASPTSLEDARSFQFVNTRKQEVNEDLDSLIYSI